MPQESPINSSHQRSYSKASTSCTTTTTTMEFYYVLSWCMTFASIALFFLLGRSSKSKGDSTQPPLPGPPEWPIIGHLHLAGSLDHRGLRKLATRYGPLFRLRLGRRETVVISSVTAARAVLRTQDSIFGDRPTTGASDRLLYGSSNTAFSPHGPRWRSLRRISIAHLLGPAAVASITPAIEHYIANVTVDRLCKRDGKPFDVNAVLAAMIVDFLSDVVMGKTSEWEDAKDFEEMVEEYGYLLSTPDVGDYLPWAGLLDFTGFKKRQRKAYQTADRLYEKIVAEHRESDAGKRRKDFVDILSDIKVENELGPLGMKTLILDMMNAGTETTYKVVEWVLTELLRHPEVLRKAQDELHAVVGPDRRVSNADVDSLTYVRAVVKETLRLYTPAPLLLPRLSRADCHVDGYLIPRGTTVIVNSWSLARDPALWGPDADSFRPERHVEGANANVEIRGGADVEALRMIPFGAGRRTCPGALLGSTIVELAVAELVHCFDWGLPDGQRACELDMGEKLGISISRVTPLIAVATPRPAAHAPRLDCQWST